MELALEAGAEDVLDKGDYYEVLCALADYDTLSQALTDQSMTVESSELAYLANVHVPIDDAELARKVLRTSEAERFLLSVVTSTIRPTPPAAYPS